MALDEFINRISRVNVASQNRFKVSFQPPAGLAANRNVNLVTETISMPGQNIRSVPDDLRFGPAREQAQGVTYGPFSATFICTPGLPEKAFFEAWQELVFNKGEDEWQVKFYKDYYGSITISHLDRQNEEKYIMTVHEAYPKTIQEQQYSLGSNDAHQTVTVEFTYRWWSKEVEEVEESVSRAADRHPPAPPPAPDDISLGEAEGGDEHATPASAAAKASGWIAGYEKRSDGTWGRKLT